MSKQKPCNRSPHLAVPSEGRSNAGGATWPSCRWRSSRLLKNWPFGRS